MTVLGGRLTAQDLAECWNECPTPAMRRVLKELARMHCTIKRANSVRQAVGDIAPRGVDPITWQCFIVQLSDEPCLTDTPTPRQLARSEAYLARTLAAEHEQEQREKRRAERLEKIADARRKQARDRGWK
jgi:hypothetical protein